MHWDTMTLRKSSSFLGPSDVLTYEIIWCNVCLVSKFHKTLVNPSMILKDLSSAPCEYALSGFNGSELQRGVRMGGIYYNRYKGAFLNV